MDMSKQMANMLAMFATTISDETTRAQLDKLKGEFAGVFASCPEPTPHVPMDVQEDGKRDGKDDSDTLRTRAAELEGVHVAGGREAGACRLACSKGASNTGR